MLIKTVESFWVMTGPLIKVFHVKTSGLDYSGGKHRHEAILDALTARDSEAAAAAIQDDLAWGGKIMIDWLAEREKKQVISNYQANKGPSNNKDMTVSSQQG